MKIFSEYKPNESGKGKFLSRLFPELRKLGCDVVFHPDGADAKLALTRVRMDHTKHLPCVLRVDGIHLVDNKKNNWNNKRVRSSIKKVDHVIYQSQFAKRMVNGILKVNPASTVIYNGADPDQYKTNYITNPEDTPGVDVIMVARWADRRHKRLKEMLQIAEALPQFKFAVCGEIDSDYTPKLVNVNYHGRISDHALSFLLRKSKCMLNLGSYDWCPNAVVESIVAGVPVIGYNDTGIGELISNGGGHLLEPSEKLTPRMIKKEYLPKINIDEAAEEVILTVGLNDSAYKPSLYIKNIAQQYYEVFKKVCSI